VLIILLVYVPGLNTFFTLTFVEPKYACNALWFMPIFFVYDEFRKYNIRQDMNGIWAKLTLF
jgi:hypothetical protein